MIDNGFTGMSFFFVLSGFVLTISHWERPIVFSDFIVNWAARLVPAFAVAFLISYSAYATDAPWPATAMNLLANATLTQAWFPSLSEMGLNRGSWSISVEMFFYLLFPILSLFLARHVTDHRKAIAWLLALWLISFLPGLLQRAMPQPGTMWIYYSFPPFRLSEFVGGIVLAIVWKRRLFEARQSLLILSGVGYVASCFAGLSSHNLTILNATAVPFVLAIIYYTAERRPRWLEFRPLVYLGEVSYGIYIYGFVTIPMAMWPLLHRGLPGAIVLAVGLFSTIALASISFHFVEQPARRFFEGTAFWRASRSAKANPRARASGQQSRSSGEIFCSLRHRLAEQVARP